MGFVGLDQAGFDPVNDGFRGYAAIFAGFEYGEHIFHGGYLLGKIFSFISIITEFFLMSRKNLHQGIILKL